MGILGQADLNMYSETFLLVFVSLDYIVSPICPFCAVMAVFRFH